MGYRGLLPDEYLDTLRAEDRAQRYTFGDTDPDRPQTIVAEHDGDIVGFASTRPAPAGSGPPAGELSALYVDPSMWGNGVGQSLITAARSQLWRQGFGDALVWVLVGNDRAERFYRSDGWGVDGQYRQQEVWGFTVDERRYRRVLQELPAAPHR